METALKSPIKTPDHQDFFDTLAPLIRGGNLRNQSRLKTLKVDDKNGKCEKERQQQKQREAEEEVKDDNTLKMSVLQAKDDEEAFLIQENLRRQAAQKNKEMERKEYRAEHKKTFTDVVFVDTERKLLRAAIKKKYTERYHTESNARHSELEMLRAFTHTLLEEGEHRRRHQEKEGGNDSKTPNNNRQRHNKHRKNKKHAKR